MVIMTFGSGFNIEDVKPEYLAQMKSLADYARGKGIALGGYSLLASRSIDAADDVINPQDRQTRRRAFRQFAVPRQRLGRKLFPQTPAVFRADRLRRSGK